jgi:membrane dipeptidase
MSISFTSPGYWLAAALAAYSLAVPASGGNVHEEALRIAQDAPIIDTHIDVPYRLEGQLNATGEWIDVGEGTGDEGDFDYPRARMGGLNGAFMSIYTPASLEQGSEPSPESTRLAHHLIDLVERMVSEHPDRFAIPHSVAEFERQVARGKLSLPLGMENGSPIAGDLSQLAHFYDRGVRYITLAHSAWNHISDSSYDPDKHWGGLSPFGRELVTAMNKQGVMVDVSHLSDAAFRDVIEVSAVPVIASHSSARHFTPGFERNMSDEMIQALAAQGGVIQINYGSSFLTAAANQYGEDRKVAYRAYLAENQLEDSDAVDEAFRQQYREQHPYPYATLDDVLNHIDHVVDLVGIDHVGIGSDYDGVGDSLPTGLKDVSSYPNLVSGLLTRGYTEQEITKVLGGNLLRVWRAAEAYAQSH